MKAIVVFIVVSTLMMNSPLQAAEAESYSIFPFSGKLQGTVPAPENDLTLWYRQPATEWTQALAIGNGRLGAMVFGGIAEEHIQLNEATL
jgi:hypothetical protein